MTTESTSGPPLDRSSLVQVRVGNRVYDARFSKKCVICNHPARMRIEEMLVEGHPYASIADSYSEVELHEGNLTRILPEFNGMQLRQHYVAGHMPTQSAAVRQLVEERAKELGLAYEEQTRKVVDQVLVARTVMAKGYEAVARGDLTPSVRESLAAADLLHRFEQDAATSLDAEAWSEAFEVYFTTARQVMPPEVWEQFTQQLATNPILRALQQRAERGEQSAIEGEIVHDIDTEGT